MFTRAAEGSFQELTSASDSAGCSTQHCLHEEAKVSLRPTGAARPNKMDPDAVIPWSNLAELLTQHLVSQVNGTVSSPRVNGRARIRHGSLTDGDHLSENHVFGNGVWGGGAIGCHSVWDIYIGISGQNQRHLTLCNVQNRAT